MTASQNDLNFVIKVVRDTDGGSLNQVALQDLSRLPLRAIKHQKDAATLCKALYAKLAPGDPAKQVLCEATFHWDPSPEAPK